MRILKKDGAKRKRQLQKIKQPITIKAVLNQQIVKGKLRKGCQPFAGYSLLSIGLSRLATLKSVRI